MMIDWTIAPITATISILVALYLYFYINRQSAGTEKMQEISNAIQEGARAFMKVEFKYLATFVAVMAVILTFVPMVADIGFSYLMGIAFVFGALCSAFSGVLGMTVALKANVRAANAAKEGLNKAFPIAFRGGAVMGLAVVGLALLGLSTVYYFTMDPEIVLGFGFGASAVALFAKIGGGIYTKTADVAADLVGKVEHDIPEDDPRNPGVIADNVGDNVGDVAGMGSDLFDSYVASIIAVMTLGVALSQTASYVSISFVDVPLVFAGLGIIASILGVAIVRVGKKGNPGKALNIGTYLTCIIFALMTLGATYYLDINIGVWAAAVIGLIGGVVIGITTDFFTSIDKFPVIRTAEASQTGAAVNIITGFSYGLLSIFPALLGIGFASAGSYMIAEYFIEAEGAGVYGIGMAAVGMLSIVGMIVAGDAFGPIADNAGGIAEQTGLDEEVLDITASLDAAGNTSKAITKGFAIGAAGLTVIALLAAFQAIVQEKTGALITFDLMDPLVLTGALVGLTIPAVFSAMVMLSVGKNASCMIEEIRRQFREIPGLLEGKEGVKADYAACVDIATKGAIKELILPSVLSIGITLIVGFIGGIQALGGFLAGSIFSGLIFALFMSNAGGLWDNAKKYIEAGAFGGKGSEPHKAAVVGDTVGDPFKDTAGPSLNTLITVMALVASVFAPTIVLYALL
ncbi:MAG: sodium-translocating pyrophosphatase [Candidatus Bathyarchaeota archaeon]|nr:sodium-translocating pyrophosphatase [Candidatus Bathyarchaeum tardum]WGM90211.1 MAG: sodium-translocating pyrophosphatase [Candidatus Bathyarchaeum tardum]WNZ29702.1 MAG: sodium-translocating pyrophosphatase [Candidatus Bathyarchaeota archaeon]